MVHIAEQFTVVVNYRAIEKFTYLQIRVGVVIQCLLKDQGGFIQSVYRQRTSQDMREGIFIEIAWMFT